MKSIHTLCAALSLFLFGCATRVPDGVQVKKPSECVCNIHDRSAIHIRYLGSAGLLFEYGGKAVLTAPFFSNHSFLSVVVAPISPKPGPIDRLLPNLDTVDAILVGHSHHDHLIDLPYILKTCTVPATVYGNKTMVNLLTGNVPNQLVDIEALAGDFDGGATTGTWQTVSDGSIRFMALKSMHAPHFAGHTFFKGQVTESGKPLPRTAWGWKCGTPLAFIIDFMKDGNKTVAYRIVFNDSAVDGDIYGKLPAMAGSEPVDLAVMCMASFSQVKNYPEGYLDKLQPKRVFIAHWEDFFRPQTKTPKVVRHSDMKAFLKKLPSCYKPDPFVLHAPGSCELIRLDKP